VNGIGKIEKKLKQKKFGRGRKEERKRRRKEAVRRACERAIKRDFCLGINRPLTGIDQLYLNPSPPLFILSAITQVTLLVQTISKWYHRNFT
jgi:hypothetical protein